MMYSGKPPPLKAFTNGGTPSSKDASSTEGLIQQPRAVTSENCDPNLSVGGNEVAIRKAESSPVLEVSHRYYSAANGSILQSPKQSGAAGAAHSECEAAGESKEEVNRPAANKSPLPSPTKASVPHQHGHGHRAHFCRSPRCASNNPDYATPVQPTPRKYLVSKRHLLPGAICTKDPAVLASQTQELAITPPHAPSTGKPPKPSRKLENVFQQSASLTNVSERNTAPISYECSPTRIPKPPSARPSPGVHESKSSPDQLPSSVYSQLTPPPATETHSPSFLIVPQDLVSEKSLEDEEIPQERLPESDGNESEHMNRLGFGTCCDDVVEASTPPTGSDAGESSPQASESDVIFAGEPGSELASSPESPIPSCPAELPISLSSDQLSPEPEAPMFAAASSSSSPVPVSSIELEDVTEKLALKLALETVEETPVKVTECCLVQDVSSTDVLEGRTESEEHPSISRVQGAEEQISKLDSALLVAEESGGDCPAEENSDGGDHAEENSDGGDCQAEENSSKNGGDCPAEENSDGGDCHAEGNSDGGDCQAEENSGGRECQAEENSDGGGHDAAQNADERDCEAGRNVDGEDFQVRDDTSASENAPSSGGMEGQEVRSGRSIASYIEELDNAQSKATDGQREVPKYVRGKGRQLWRSDCRDSREVVFLKQTPQTDRRAGGDWMVDNILEGEISKLSSTGKGRVKVLVEAFESMMNLNNGDADMSERRASRVWWLNRMEKGEVDEDGDEFEDGDRRVDCYEVSGDGLQLRASLRLSLGGGHRLPSFNSDEVDEIEMSAIQKVQDWDDDCCQSQSFEDQQGSRPLTSSQPQPDGVVVHDRNDSHSENTELDYGNLQRRMSFSGIHTVLVENDRSSEDYSCDVRTESQFGCQTRVGGKGRTDTRSTFSLDLNRKYKVTRRRRYWKAGNLEPAGSSLDGGGEKDRRGMRGTLLEPFHLVTEERGMMKEYQFSKKLQQMWEEEERLRNPIAQGLPWTTDEPEVVHKPPVKDQTRPVEFRHYSDSRAIERAEFDSYVSQQNTLMEMQRQEEERLRLVAEEEEIKRMRREMVPRAQLMPFFNQPFIPTRSSKRLTVPKEPTFLNRQHKRAKCIVWQRQQQQHQHFLTQPYG